MPRRTPDQIGMAEICDVIREAHPEISVRDIRVVFNEIFDTMAEALTMQKRVTVLKFGAFSMKEGSERNLWNIHEQRCVAVASRQRVSFKAAETLRQRLNKKN